MQKKTQIMDDKQLVRSITRMAHEIIERNKGVEDVVLVAGQVVQLKGYGKLSGKYLVKQARHELRRSSGYTVELEIKMIEYVADEVQTASAQETNHAAQP